ncbi:MAG: ABC transporter permease [Eubacterium sp.]|nr:ABC transporter permease [Eubacterium sp.]
MKKSDLFSMAIQNLRNRKTRTRLTVIGVVIGTCAIVIMVSIGIGIDKMITSQYESDSALCKIEVHGVDTEKTDGKEIPFDDTAVEYFKGIDNVKLVSPTLIVSEYVSISRGKYNNGWSTIKAIDFDSMPDMGYALIEGSFDKIDKRNTLLFGKSSMTTFTDAQGNQAKYKYDENYEIIESEIDLMKDIFSIAPKINSSNDYNGYMDYAPQTGNSKKIKAAGILKTDNSVDYETGNGIFIDLELGKELMRESQKLSNQPAAKFQYSEINVYVDNMQNVKAVKEQLQDNGFYCYSSDDEIEYTKKIMMVVQLVLGGIGAISMFVAAFGISNTMVMSVFERTKEIGIMKVLGCDIKDIKAMFLYEAGTIGLLGGTIGIIISYILSISANAVARLVASSMDIGDMGIKICVSSIPLWLAAAGILFSVMIGVIAGLSPAKRSVKVSALTAIHNE